MVKAMANSIARDMATAKDTAVAMATGQGHESHYESCHLKSQ